MKYKRNFLTGEVPIEKINNIESLLLRQFNIARAPRGFQVLALPEREVVYWSFSRKKANNFIKEQAKVKGITHIIDESVKIKSLEYNHKYTPNEYLFGSVLYLSFFLFLILNGHSYFEFFPIFLFVLSSYMLHQHIYSNFNKKALTSSSSGTDNP